MRKDQIRFIWGLGTHGTYDMINARKKLGEEIVENYAVYNHDPFQNTVRVGRTPTGVELWFNREFMACDLKVAIGCITPHVHVGFGGGAKLILPGVAGFETINQFHNQLYRDRERTGLGNFENNIMRAECDAAGDAVGLNFKIDCLLNRRGEITNLYAGPFKATHAAGAEEGKEHYGIPYSSGYDLAICNAYAKANESAIALFFSLMLLKPKEGVAVLISDAPEGQVPHYVMRVWGSDYGGRHFNPRPRGFVNMFMKKLIVLAPYPDRTSLDLVAHVDDAVFVKTWPEVLAILEKDFPGSAKVAVVQDGTMMYMKNHNHEIEHPDRRTSSRLIHKFEIRSTKSENNTECPKFKLANREKIVWLPRFGTCFRFLIFEFVSDFGFRYSDFSPAAHFDAAFVDKEMICPRRTLY
jgi:hypothetical protein